MPLTHKYKKKASLYKLLVPRETLNLDLFCNIFNIFFFSHISHLYFRFPTSTPLNSHTHTPPHTPRYTIYPQFLPMRQTCHFYF